MKIYKLLVFTVFLLVFEVKAQSIFAPVSARVIGIGDAAITINGYWASFQNTAGITDVEDIEVGATYENKYGMSSMNMMAAGVASKTAIGHFSAGVFRFGDDLYNEHKVSLGYATEVGIIKIGGRVNYLQYQVMGFGDRYTYSIDFGGIATLSPHLIAGAQALNISQSSLDLEADQAVPTILKFGLSYRPKVYFMLNAEIEKDLMRKALIKLGAEYNLLKKFYLRSGLNSGSFQSFYGAGFSYLNFQWDYALSSHLDLGFSHSISMQYKVRRK